MRISHKAKCAWNVLKETFAEWSEDNASRLAASLAFYTLLSLAPLVVLAVAVAGWFYGEEAARGQIAGELGNLVGPQGAEGIQAVVENARAPETGLISSLFGIAVLLFGASGVFIELRTAINEIWDVETKKSAGIRGLVMERLFSFSLVLGVAFLLLVSTVLSAMLSAFGKMGEESLPGGEVLWQVINFSISFVVIAGVFAMMFKYLPDTKVSFRDVRFGACVTALLFVIGKSLIGLYLGRSSVASAYGAAGSVVVLVVWVYYSAQILFMGAELTQVWAKRYGEPSRAQAPSASETPTSTGATPGARLSSTS